MVDAFLTENSVKSYDEIGAYECLWQQPGSSTKRLADLCRANPGSLPSDLVSNSDAVKATAAVLARFKRQGVEGFGVRINGTPDYPSRLRDAADPVELLYFMGLWELASAPRRIAVVGSRQVSAEGVARTRKLVRGLVQRDFTIVSGLAQGVDTVAHETAIAADGRTIAVIGTPISEVYPRENAALQRRIAAEHLLISQVPVLRYLDQPPQTNRLFFPERNKTMAAVSEATATAIVEAGERSGTLIQARAALMQGRKLFILDNNFRNVGLTWPEKYEKLGAVRVRSLEDIVEQFEA